MTVSPRLGSVRISLGIIHNIRSQHSLQVQRREEVSLGVYDFASVTEHRLARKIKWLFTQLMTIG